MPRLTGATLATLRAQASLQVRSRPLDRPLFELLEPEADRGLARLPEPSRRRRVLRLRGRPVLGRGRPRVPVRHRATRRTASGATGRCGRRRAPRRSRRSSSGWAGSLLGWTSTPTCTCSTSTPTSRRRSRSWSRATRSGSTSSTSCCGARCWSISTASAGRRSARASRATGSRRSSRSSASSATPSCAARSARCGAGRPGRTTATRSTSTASPATTRTTAPQRARCTAGCSIAGPRPRRSTASTLDALQPEPPKPPGPKLAAYLARLEAMRPRLLPGLPDDESEDTDEQRAVRTTFDLLGYHSREAKPAYWALYARREQVAGPAPRRGPRGAGRPRGDRGDDRGQPHHLADAVPRAGVQARPGQSRRPARRAPGGAARAR